jgi:multimeric flavodoxin WrbA
MIEPVFTKEGQETLKVFLSPRPAFIQEKRRQLLLRSISLFMHERGVTEADRELVIEAAKLVLHTGETAPFHRLDTEPTRYKTLTCDNWCDLDAYYAQPQGVTRWDILGAKDVERPANPKVLAICASPRAGGNTDVLIDEAIRGAADAGAEVEKIRLQKMNIRFCSHCAKCYEPGYTDFCSLKDDLSGGIYQKIVDADTIIIGFPIYEGRECSQLTTFFDRWYGFGRFMKGKPRVGMVISCWGSPWPDSYAHAVEHLIHFLHIFGITTVEALVASGLEGVLHGLDDKKKAIIRKYPDEVAKAYLAGKSLVTN